MSKLILNKSTQSNLLTCTFKIKIQQWKYVNKNMKITIFAMKVNFFLEIKVLFFHTPLKLNVL
jgi:hypothetical protein